jgi:glutathione S-transferase
VLAEKDLEYETVVIDLDDRPAWLYAKNPSGRVPVLEEGEFVLPESAVIMEYLDERYPEPPLLPLDPAERAFARLWLDRHDERLATDYYARRGGRENRLDERLAALDEALQAHPYLSGREYGLADIGYIPWILRAPVLLDIDLDPYEAIREWTQRLLARPAVAAEAEVVGTLAPA